MKKRYLLIASALILAFVLASIAYIRSRHDSDAKISDLYFYDSISPDLCYSEENILYLDDDGILHLIDSESGKDIIYCDKPNCTHEPYSHNNENPSCPAVFYGLSRCGPVLYGNHLYFIGNMEDEDILTQYVYEMDINGENRKRIARIHGVQNVRYALFRDGYLCVAYYNRVEVNDDGQIINDNKPSAGIFVVDLNSGNVYMGEVMSAEQANITELYYENDKVYYSVVYFENEITETALENSNGYENFAYENMLHDVYFFDIKQQKTNLIREINHIYSLELLSGNAYFDSEEGYFVLNKETGEISAIEAVTDKVPSDEMLFRGFEKAGDILYFSFRDETGEVVYCRISGDEAEELLRLPEENSFGIQCICGDIVYINYTDERGFCLGLIRLDDFNNGIYQPRRLKYYNEE